MEERTCPECGKVTSRFIRTVCSACYHRHWKDGTHKLVPARPKRDYTLRTEKKCPRCDRVLPIESFSVARDRSDGRMGWCRGCYASNRLARAEHYREFELKRRHGIDLAEYNRMMAEQGGKCAICRGTCVHLGDRLSVDHDHATGKVRALLCGKCNKGIGMFDDDPVLLRAAIAYLARHSAVHAAPTIDGGW